jgi:hypothetical protein
MTAVWRGHLIICLCLGALTVPIYFIDQALFTGTGGGNWITLDFGDSFFGAISRGWRSMSRSVRLLFHFAGVNGHPGFSWD